MNEVRGSEGAQQNNDSIIGIYGAGGSSAGDNPTLERIVESKGGIMFASSFGSGDSEIIEHIIDEFEKGKDIKIYGYSRGGVAAIRIANKLFEHNVTISEINIFDPVSLSGDLVFLYPNVLSVNNYYQQNETDLFISSIKFEYAENPFKGSKVKATYQWPYLNQIDFTGAERKGRPVNHNNIIRHAYNLE